MGGAINRVGPTETAYAERSALWMSSIDGNWENGADTEANTAWVRESFRQIAPVSSPKALVVTYGGPLTRIAR